MKWSDIDNEREVWTINPEESKNSQRLTIPLLPQVIEILTRRRKTSNSTFVFPSNSASGHYQEPKKAWHTLLKRADIKNVRIHDLRRTMGSYQTMTGASTTIVGKTLGHKSQQSTAVYARMTLDPVRDSMHAAVELMMKTKQRNPGSKP
jgi:integrase